MSAPDQPALLDLGPAAPVAQIDTRTAAVEHMAALYEGGWSNDAAQMLRALVAERDDLLAALRAILAVSERRATTTCNVISDAARAALARAEGRS